MNGNRRRVFVREGRLLAGLALIVLLAATGCTGTPVTRAGSDVDPVSLTSTYGNGAGGVGSDVINQLVTITAQGPVTVETPSVTPGSDDNDGDAVKRLQAGEAEIATVRSDALEGAGVTTMAALTAPFGVTNEAQALRIAADPIATTIMAGLERIGLVGLRLLPGGLRHPVGYKTPLLAPGDYKGEVINTRPGPGVERIITALGSRLNHSVNAARSKLVVAGTLRGIEVSYLQGGAVDRPAVATSNVTLYTKFDVVVIRKGTFDTLSVAQQEALRAAVDKAIAAALAARSPEGEALLKWCNTNDTSAVTASPDVVRQLTAALTPVTDGLRADRTIAEALDRFAALHEGTEDPVGTTCDGPLSAEAARAPFRVKPRGDQTVLDGTWRLSATMDELLAAGVPVDRAAANAGVWTVQITRGKGTWSQPSGEPCDGNFSFAGNKVTLDMDVRPDNGCDGVAIGTYERKGDTVTFRWTGEYNGELVLDNVLLKTLVKVG